MIPLDWQIEVKEALEQVPNSRTYFVYPETWPEPPVAVITYACLNDIAGAYADDGEYATEITVKADVWHKNPDTVHEVSKEVIRQMRNIGYERKFVCDLYERETGLHHKSMRFQGGF